MNINFDIYNNIHVIKKEKKLNKIIAIFIKGNPF